MSEIEEIKKLAPEERAKKLKELIEKRKKEVEAQKKELEEQKKEIEEQSKEIEEAEKLTEKTKKEEAEQIIREKMAVPELEEVNVANLFEQKEEDLENKVEKAPQTPTPEEGAEKLYQFTPDAPTHDMYASATNLYQQIKERGTVTPEMADLAGSLQYAIGKKQEDMNKGSYNANDEIETQANLVKSIADKILSLYTAGTKRDTTFY